MSLKHISSFLLSSPGFLASLPVGGTKTQGKDASEGNVDAIKRLGMHPQTLDDFGRAGFSASAMLQNNRLSSTSAPRSTRLSE